MLYAHEVILNELAQGLRPVDGGVEWFEGLSVGDQRKVLHALVLFCGQARAREEDVPESKAARILRCRRRPSVPRPPGEGDDRRDRQGVASGSALGAVPACCEELITRNVAKLVEPPCTATPELRPWTLDETLDFLAAIRKDPLYAAFVLAIAMGLRRGEIVGLRWSDLDLDNRVLYVRHQVQRRRGVLYDDDPKGRRRRAVPIPALCIAPLRWHRMRQTAARAKAGERWKDSDYVFPATRRPGTLVDRG